MPRPRRTQISLEDTPYYHCCSRVVRRAFLCGDDSYSGKNYDHRRAWVESLLFELEAVFAIDVAAFAVMSNHLHLVLRVDIETANHWTDREVLEQWHKLFKGDALTQKFAKGELVEAHEVSRLKHSIALYRSRLCDISWFMRCLNEPIARQANQEDNCTGRFWEGRFKSQALLDEAAVLACMAYVDLNPIRAQLADTLEQSDHTSIQLRIRAALKGEQPSNLLPFIGNECDNQPNGIEFSLTDYLQLVDDTSRIIRNDKRGCISESSAKILNRLNIPHDNWLKLTTEFGKLFHGPVGTLQELTDYCEHLEKRRRHFASSCQHFHCK
ncbi:transposase [Shewanella xiamenensis]|uniref:transposase n=1 Tax=Shewanella xiamenensis TaxID=332186 RepID=UPI0011862041|nr:transposase [Shewanella xiamenensis]TVL21995.1 transposase [Shewanella xiamenensis]TVL22136.1 transposase [Shewanella xiamenensis]TVL27883.1 transposase [Shewanella xiamenensis]TVL35776.1 transposase [Shewanella xiamenensis]TVP04014.1 transposase [Shewanella xiamenensis]